MRQALLLIVEESFVLDSRGVVLIPDFPVPAAGWSRCVTTVTVDPQDQESFTSSASLELNHFNIPGALAEQRWRVVVTLQRETPVPRGTHVLAPAEVVQALVGTGD